MGSPVKFRDFSRWFAHFDVRLEINKSSHIKMYRIIDGVSHQYTAVVHKNLVDDVYLKKARKALKLTPEDGVSDEDFFN
jgi:hypothetical protein